MRTLFPLLALPMVLGACLAAPGPAESVGEIADPLVSYDCATSQDTGYVNGNPFAITLVHVDGEPVEIDTANAFVTLAQAAENDGVQLHISSGFRTMAEQQYYYDCYTNCNCNSCSNAAKPGYSNHQSGHALDLNTYAGGVSAWLNAHGGSYGWSRTVPSEAWHWEWWGGGPAPTPYCATADWGAQFVSQSWPLASTTMSMSINQKVPATITLKNIGKKAWDSNTKLATTQPRDRVSPFVAADWLAPNRLAQVTGTVAPGDSFTFPFTFQAPSTPGLHDEFYGVVEEGVTWFSEAGQAGPPDNFIEVKIQVNEAAYHGKFVSQTYPTLQDPPIMMTTGQTMNGTITLTNIGTATWKAGETKLAPTPRDEPSSIGGAGWLSTTRVSSPTADVAPGGTFAFPLQITAGAPGDYTQTFSLVEEGVTWFADGGGPSDNLLAIHVIVTAEAGASGSGGSSSSSNGGSGGGETSSGSGAGGGDPGTVASPSGCSCRAARDEGRDGPPAEWLAAAGVALIATRRRRGL